MQFGMLHAYVSGVFEQRRENPSNICQRRVPRFGAASSSRLRAASENYFIFSILSFTMSIYAARVDLYEWVFDESSKYLWLTATRPG